MQGAQGNCRERRAIAGNAGNCRERRELQGISRRLPLMSYINIVDLKGNWRVQGIAGNRREFAGNLQGAQGNCRERRAIAGNAGQLQGISSLHGLLPFMQTF